MKRKLLTALMMLLFACHPSYLAAITNSDDRTNSVEQSPLSAPINEPTLLLQWQENKLVTTKGTFLIDSAEIINRIGIAREAVATAKAPPRIDMEFEENRLIKAIIRTNR